MRSDCPGRRPAALAIGSFAVLAASSALASSSGFENPAAGARVETGQTIAVEWALPSSSASGLEESELLLSLDGGTTFPLRLTRAIAPGSRRILWRVPALPTTRARLALRTGSGDSDSEIIRLISREFTIVASPRPSLEELFRVGEEWRTADALERPQQPAPEPGSLRGDEQRMVSTPARAAAVENRPDLLERPGPSQVARPSASDPVLLTCFSRSLPGHSSLTPRRE